MHLRAHDTEVAVEWHLPGTYKPETMALSSKALDGFEGARNTEVSLTLKDTESVKASWEDGRMPQWWEYSAIPPERLPPFPVDPAKFASMDGALPQPQFAAIFWKHTWYDVFGNRVEKDVITSSGTTTQRYALDGWNPAKSAPVGNENFDVWAELDGSNALATRYLRGDNVDQLLARVDVGTSGTTYWTLTSARTIRGRSP